MRSKPIALAATLALTLAATPAHAQADAEPDLTLGPRERREVIDSVLARVRETYVFADVAEEMEKAVRARLRRGEYERVAGARALADSLTAHLRAVSRDKHLSVLYRHEPFAPERPDPAAAAEQEAARRAWSRFNNAGFVRVERLGGNVGYLKVDAFMPPELAEGAARGAMEFVANTDALVIDLRDNQGGRPETVAMLLSWLFGDRAVHTNSVYWRDGDSTKVYRTTPSLPGRRYGESKPVYVLTSGRTFSAGEEMAYDLQAMKRATLVGEATGGGAHPVRGRRATAHFLAVVPGGRAINPVTGGNWEGTGVRPDVAAPETDALTAAHRLALEALLPKTDDAYQQTQIRRALAALGATAEGAATGGR